MSITLEMCSWPAEASLNRSSPATKPMQRYRSAYVPSLLDRLPREVRDQLGVALPRPVRIAVHPWGMQDPISHLPCRHDDVILDAPRVKVTVVSREHVGIHESREGPACTWAIFQSGSGRILTLDGETPPVRTAIPLALCASTDGAV